MRHSSFINMSRGYMCQSKVLLIYSLALFWLCTANGVLATVTLIRGSVVNDLYRHKPLTTFDPKRKTVGIVTVPISKKLAGRIADQFSGCKECQEQFNDMLEHSGKLTFFPMSYAKWVSQHKVNVVPIDVNMSIKKVRRALSRLNGILLPGGSTPVYDHQFERILIDIGITSIKKKSQYTERVKRIVDSVITYNEKNPEEKIVIWGTCLGMEEMLLSKANDNFVFSDVVNKDENRKIEFIDNDSAIKKFFSYTMNNSIFDAKYYFNHKYALYVSQFNKYPELKANFRVVAQSYTKEPYPTKPIVAMIEHLTEPIYGVQFHPEKNRHESTVETDQGTNTLNAVDQLGLFFVNKLSKPPKFNDIEYWRRLYGNYFGYFVQKVSHYDEIVIFVNKAQI